MKNWIRQWNFMRLLRLGLGILIIVQGFLTKEWLYLAIGGWLTAMPLLNVGCCGTSGCNVPAPKRKEGNGI